MQNFIERGVTTARNTAGRFAELARDLEPGVCGPHTRPTPDISTFENFSNDFELRRASLTVQFQPASMRMASPFAPDD
jgi:hypothetical protein